MAAAAMCGMMSSCQKDEIEPNVAKGAALSALSIDAFISHSGETRAFVEKSAWSAGDKLGVFILNRSDENAFAGTVPNMPYTYGATGWSNPATISISDALPRVCAYFAHDTSKGDLKAIPFSPDKDFLFSTPSVPSINNLGKADVRLAMKHALSQFRFKLNKTAGYKGAGTVSALKVVKKTGNMFASGKVNLLTGAITGVTPVNQYAYVASKAPTAGNGTGGVYGAVVMPSSGNFVLEMTIDGRNYTCALNNVSWQSGKRYIYSLTLDKSELSIGGGENGDGSGVTVEDWTDINSGNLNLSPGK